MYKCRGKPDCFSIINPGDFPHGRPYFKTGSTACTARGMPFCNPLACWFLICICDSLTTELKNNNYEAL
jgi:hypothetical protein